MSIFRFHIGSISCLSVSAGEGLFNVRAFFANAPEDELKIALQKHGITSEKILTPFNCLLVNQRILIDTGMGGDTLVQNLKTAGIAPEDIEMVILSHLHHDHAGGIFNQAGKAVFPKARHLISKAEYQAGGEMLTGIRTEIITSETEILPGIKTFPVPGHSPGQIAVKIQSGGEQLIYTADTIAHPIHLEHPEWYILSDSDSAQAIETRRKMLARLAGENVQAFVYHFPFPGLYSIECQ